MKIVNFQPTYKQALALQYLTDTTTTEILYGGAAGGGKSFLGCVWITTMCLNYKGTRFLIGRSVLKTLKETTLKTLFEVLSLFQLKQNHHYTYNITEGVITFYNGSEILLKDLQDKPSDPDWDSLGSLEITGAFIDEAAQVSEKCKNVVSSRIRYKTKQYKLTGKVLMTCNPSQGWLYTSFYKPYTDNALPEYRKFIPATLRDNTHIDESYAKRLAQLDSKSRKRLLDGDWHYFTDEDSMIPFDNIIQMFEPTIPDEKGTMYISADIAGSGKDKTVIMVWNNLTVIDIITLTTSTTDEVTKAVNAAALKYNVHRKNIIFDSIGIGEFGKSAFKSAIPFKSSNSPIGKLKSHYTNLRSQCAYRLAEIVNESGIRVQCSYYDRETIIEELEQLKRDKVDTDSKLAIIPKDKMKKALNRSPDYLDCFIMRMYWEVYKYSGEYAMW